MQQSTELTQFIREEGGTPVLLGLTDHGDAQSSP